MKVEYSYFAPCPRGVEALLADELRRLRLAGVRPQRGGVLFRGTIRDAYKTLLWSRLASRVLLSLGSVDASDSDALYAAIGAIAWEDHVAPEGTIAIDTSGVNPELRNTQFTTVRVKDAVVDRLRERFGTRPSIDTTAPDLRINVVVAGAKAKIAIDLSGDPLHRRGYRVPGVQVVAPMKETLAAAMLEVAGWREIAAAGGGFLDPLCGSGTLAIEAAMVAADMAPGLLRSTWGFDRWLGHDADAWTGLLDEADARCEAGLESVVPITASDSDPAAVKIAVECIRRAGLARHVVVEQVSLENVMPPAGATSGLIACNPPYGERLSQRGELPALYAVLGNRVREHFSGWNLAVITPDNRLAGGLGLTPVTVHELYNGPIAAPVSVFVRLETASPQVVPDTPVASEVSEPPVDAQAPSPPSSQPDSPAVAAPATALVVEPGSPEEAFANRLRKMAKHIGQWARRTGASCYRVYDADLPDYNVAVDVYAGAAGDSGRRFAHVAEYAPPADVDTGRAAARMEWAREAVANVLGIDPADVFLKRRERQRGTAQYERVSRSGVTATVAENGLLFEVNLSDYLDTGLFLDHRDTRAWIRELSDGARFLNLFAYTGTASVYAAAGKAVSTTTVDLSGTYLEWAGRNMELNGVSGPQHSRVQADVVQWLETARRNGNRYELVFCDPPTFSNSKRMRDTWDVQRDHVGLITAAARLLSDGGTLVFSCNRRKFTLDSQALLDAGMTARDVTRRTIPKDFERTPHVHSCWAITRQPDSTP